MYKKFPEYYEPLDIVRQYHNFHMEMSREDCGVICGMIKEFTPQKIVEVGVSAGGSTCLILKCMELLGQENFTMKSLDLSEKFYLDNSKEAGYLLKENQSDFTNRDRHEFLLGKYTVERLKELGDNIDFLFLDTVHSIPGEILDFLVLYPHLAPNAIVVLHDTNLHNMCICESYSNRLLIASVVGNKFYTNQWRFLNVGAFQITEETSKYITDVFSALLLPWHYQENAQVLDLYKDEYRKHYSEECIEIWNNVVECMEHRFDLKKKTILEVEDRKIEKVFSRNRKIFIYGCGFRGKKLLNYIKRKKYEIYGMIVSDEININTFDDISEIIYHFSELPLNENECEILLAVESPEVKAILEESNYRYTDFEKSFFNII